jgi:predicted DNA-binding transcriptional regulator AlpA
MSTRPSNSIVANLRGRRSEGWAAEPDNLARVSDPDHPLGTGWLTVRDIAALLNVREVTIRAWLSRGRFPEPDGHVGANNVWRRSTIEEWAAQRPRKGRSIT